MADADEDEIPRSIPSANGSHDPDYDPEDEAQDFRFLATIIGANTSLPKRGEKDFEPNPTKAQQNVLIASREAMHNALAVERVHIAKSACVGVYLPNPSEWWRDVTTDKVGPGARCVVVERFKGVHNKSIGKEDFRNWTWLLPEEALFLLERGSLDIRWPEEGTENIIVKISSEEKEGGDVVHKKGSITKDSPGEGGDLQHDNTKASLEVPKAKSNKDVYSVRIGELPMSLQGAYACLIGKSGLSLERYSVYAGLRRLGYVVQRAPTWDETGGLESDTDQNDNIDTNPSHHQLASPPNMAPLTLMNRLMSWISSWNRPLQHNSKTGPLLRPGLYRSYNDIFKALALVPAITPRSITRTKPEPPFNIHFTILKPSSLATYRKSSPPSPDFIISVVNARTTSIPTLSEIGTLLDSLPEDMLPKEKKMETRLKHGRRNVVLAVVDCGIVSYLRVADMGFAELGRLYEEKVRRGTKGGYRGRGGGRGGRGGRGGIRGGRGDRGGGASG